MKEFINVCTGCNMNPGDLLASGTISGPVGLSIINFYNLMHYNFISFEINKKLRFISKNIIQVKSLINSRFERYIAYKVLINFLKKTGL